MARSADRSFLFLFTASLAAVAMINSSCSAPHATAPPPETRVDDVVDRIHGVDVPDPYRWLEDQESPETRAWIDAQNAYTDSRLDQLSGREALEQRLSELMKIDQVGFPVARGGRYFFSKRGAEQDLAVIYMRQGIDGEDEVLLDPHPMSEDNTTSVGLLDVSDDGKRLVYAVRQGGRDEITPMLFDVDRREAVDEGMPEDRYFGAALGPDGESVYYTRLTDDGPRLFRHRIGADVAEDVVVFGEGYGPEKILFGSPSDDGRFLVIHVYHSAAGDHVEVHLQDLEAGGAPYPVVADLEATFSAEMAGDRLMLHTDWEAPNGRVFDVDPKEPARAGWSEIVAERPDSVIQSVSAVGGRLFVNYLRDVQSRVVSFDLAGRELGEISFDALGTVSNMGGRFQDDESFFAFTSFHIPTTIYRYDVDSGERSVWAESEVPIDSDLFEVRQVWFRSKDGTRVPMFVVHRKDLELDGSNPTLLTGYGGFTASLTPSFSSTAAAWVEMGGVYAVANLRGGGEFGEEWHRAGMLDNKQNTFDDFIAAAEWLIAERFTSSERLAVQGGSNGGLLVGALMTQRPELVEAVICSYPLLDMVRYHRFLVASYWVPEYGSSEDPEQFETLFAYSPYHRVEPGTEYPAVLFITGDGDTRVAPLHARKMAALMQAATGSDQPVLLRYHTKAGHSGGQPVSEQIENAVDSLSFLRWQLGV